MDKIKESCPYCGKIYGYCEFCGRLAVCYTKEEIKKIIEKEKENNNNE